MNFKFSCSTHRALSSHPYNKIKRNVQEQMNRGVRIPQEDPFENVESDN